MCSAAISSSCTSTAIWPASLPVIFRTATTAARSRTSWRSSRRCSASPPETSGAILLLVPFYSIESWLYLNKRQLDTLKLSEDQRAKVYHWLEEHFRESTGYDHIEQVKHACTLSNKHNGELSKGFPRERALRHSPSFRSFYGKCEGSERLRHLLQLEPSETP